MVVGVIGLPACGVKNGTPKSMDVKGHCVCKFNGATACHSPLTTLSFPLRPIQRASSPWICSYHIVVVYYYL